MSNFDYVVKQRLYIADGLFDLFAMELNMSDKEELGDILFCQKFAQEKIGQSFNWYSNISTIEVDDCFTNLIYNNKFIARIPTDELTSMVKKILNIKFAVDTAEPQKTTGEFTYNENHVTQYWIKPFVNSQDRTFWPFLLKFEKLEGYEVNLLIEVIEKVVKGEKNTTVYELDEFALEIKPDCIVFMLRGKLVGEITTTEFLDMLKSYFKKLSEFKANC